MAAVGEKRLVAQTGAPDQEGMIVVVVVEMGH